MAGAAGLLPLLPLIWIVTRIFRDSVRESYRRVRAAIARINSFIQEHITGMTVVQLFNREARAYTDFEAVNELHMIAFKAPSSPTPSTIPPWNCSRRLPLRWWSGSGAQA